MRDNSLRVGDVVTRTGEDRLRVVALYDGCDEIVVETIVGTNQAGTGDIFDICYFDVDLIEARS